MFLLPESTQLSTKKNARNEYKHSVMVPPSGRDQKVHYFEKETCRIINLLVDGCVYYYEIFSLASQRSLPRRRF